MNRIDLNPKIWGPKAWFFLESCIISYPNNPTNEDKQIYKNFLTSLVNILPCSKCRFNYKNHIKEFPLNDYYLEDKDKLLTWFINIHNLASNKNYNLNSTLKYYNNFYSDKNLLNKLFCFIIIILILVFILYKNYKL